MRSKRRPSRRRPSARRLLWFAYVVELTIAGHLRRTHAFGPAIATAALATALTPQAWWNRDGVGL
jgi:hypothetical protein